MAGLPLQVGDMIALATVAQKVIEYGWGKYSNAGKPRPLPARRRPQGSDHKVY